MPPTRRRNRILQHGKQLICGVFLLLVLGALGGSPVAQARDLQGRLGLGYNSEFVNIMEPNGVAGVSLKYGLVRDLAVEGVFGISTSSPVNSLTAFKIMKNVFFETNLNFYFMAGTAFITANSKSGVEFLGGFGVEFFFPGLESLGFAMETGGSLDNLSGSFAFKTLGVSFLNAGIHFYF